MDEWIDVYFTDVLYMQSSFRVHALAKRVFEKVFRTFFGNSHVWFRLYSGTTLVTCTHSKQKVVWVHPYAQGYSVQ